MSYEALTREFLSTVTLAYPDCWNLLAVHGVLSCNIGGETYSLTIDKLCRVMGFPRRGDLLFTAMTTFQKHWVEFAGEAFKGGRSKSARIMHPSIRYVHKLLAGTMFSRTETSVVLVNEFFILRGLFTKQMYKANMGYILAQLLVEVKHYTACVSYGGTVTAILDACGVDLMGQKPMEEENLMDLCYL